MAMIGSLGFSQPSGLPVVESTKALMEDLLEESSTASFVYLEPHEVRLELLIPLKVLDRWRPLELENETVITPRERVDIGKNRLRELLRETTVLINDGTNEIVDVDMIYYEINSLSGGAPENLPVKDTLLGYILRYDAPSVVDNVTLTWERFETDEDEVLSRLYPYEETLIETTLTTAVPTMAWENNGTITAPPPPEKVNYTKGEGGWFSSPTINEEEGKEITEQLLFNIYRAFEMKKEEDIYDTLAISLIDGIIASIYIDIKESITYNQEGGATSRVSDLTLDDFTLTETKMAEGSLTFEASAQWKVSGVVAHWGHKHNRTNTFRAELSATSKDGYWRISKLNILSQDRLAR